MKHWKEERIMLVPVPEALLPVAENLEVLLQELADSLSIYAHLAAEEEQRALHRDYVEKLLAMLRATMPQQAGNEASAKLGCVELLEDWWNATENDHFAKTEGEVQSQSICICLSTDALLLEQIFQFRVEEFLCYFIQCLAGNISGNDRLLAIHFVEMMDNFAPVEAN